MDLIARYLEGADRVRSAIAGMTPEQLQARPIAGAWTTIEVVAHLADCDQFIADRMKRTIAMDRPLLLGAEGNRYPAALHYAERDIELDIRLLEITREQMAGDLRRVPDEAWDRDAVHSEKGLVTLRELMLLAIRHLESHVASIAAKREALGA